MYVPTIPFSGTKIELGPVFIDGPGRLGKEDAVRQMIWSHQEIKRKDYLYDKFLVYPEIKKAVHTLQDYLERFHLNAPTDDRYEQAVLDLRIESKIYLWDLEKSLELVPHVVIDRDSPVVIAPAPIEITIQVPKEMQEKRSPEIESLLISPQQIITVPKQVEFTSSLTASAVYYSAMWQPASTVKRFVEEAHDLFKQYGDVDESLMHLFVGTSIMLNDLGFKQVRSYPAAFDKVTELADAVEGWLDKKEMDRRLLKEVLSKYAS
ncbi:MAG: hypothetical protein J4452_00335 [Candidatus Aenigmarchaeota archaeon]|nr:hypothetical protein [Candidatus Aenigmarchaeota archaeon]